MKLINFLSFKSNTFQDFKPYQPEMYRIHLIWKPMLQKPTDKFVLNFNICIIFYFIVTYFYLDLK